MVLALIGNKNVCDTWILRRFDACCCSRSSSLSSMSLRAIDVPGICVTFSGTSCVTLISDPFAWSYSPKNSCLFQRDLVKN